MGKVVAVVPRWDGVRVITEGRRPPGVDGWDVGVSVALWGVLFFVPGARVCWSGLVALGLAAGLVEGTGSYRRWRLERELAELPEVAWERRKDLGMQRGVSYLRDGFEAYYPGQTREMLASLSSYGVDAIAVVPYGFYRQGAAEVEMGREAGDEGLYLGLMKVAHARGIRVMVKPQLWVVPGMYPGAIKVEAGRARDAWFGSYRRWIAHWARIAEKGKADLFAVGTELEHLSGDAGQWREVVREVRGLYGGALVYAANQGKDFEEMPWWDALDYIGLNEYYPLGDGLDLRPVIEKVERVQKRYGKPVILTEAGFASVAGSHREPWAEPRRPVDLEHQKRCYEAVLRAFWGKPWFAGMYWWKVSANGRGGREDRSLTPWGKPAMEVVKRYYEMGQARPR